MIEKHIYRWTLRVVDLICSGHYRNLWGRSIFQNHRTTEGHPPTPKAPTFVESSLPAADGHESEHPVQVNEDTYSSKPLPVLLFETALILDDPLAHLVCRK